MQDEDKLQSNISRGCGQSKHVRSCSHNKDKWCCLSLRWAEVHQWENRTRLGQVPRGKRKGEDGSFELQLGHSQALLNQVNSFWSYPIHWCALLHLAHPGFPLASPKSWVPPSPTSFPQKPLRRQIHTVKGKENELEFQCLPWHCEVLGKWLNFSEPQFPRL